MRIVYMGTPEFAVAPLLALLDAGHDVVGVVSQPDRPKGRKGILTPTPVKEAALARQLPVITPEKVNTPEAMAVLRQWQPELLVVAAFGQILKEELLTLAPYGAVNIHASLLPRYRGAAPIHWALINGETETGVTTMYMAKQLDAGDMILQRRIAIEENDDTGSLHHKLSQLGSELILETVALIAQGNAPRTPQDHRHSSYASMLTREHEKLNWNKDAKALVNQIRGLSPWPGSYCLWQQKPFKIWQAKLAGGSQTGKPGQLLGVQKDGVLVACGNGVLLLQLVQPAGKGKMQADAWYRGLAAAKEQCFE